MENRGGTSRVSFQRKDSYQVSLQDEINYKSLDIIKLNLRAFQKVGIAK